MQQTTAEPGVPDARSDRNSLRGIRNRAEASAGHLEDAELAHGAEPVLHSAHDAMRMMAFAFEVQHRVDHVLEHFGASQTAILRHVADEHGRDVLILGGEQKLRRGLANLTDAARRRLKFVRPDSLHGIDDDERGRQARDLFEDPLDTGLRQQVQRRIAHTEPVATTLHLMLRLFGRGVENRTDLAREVRGGLEQQRRLADAGLSSEQDERPGDDAATEHAVELVDAGGQAHAVRHFNFCVQPGG